MLKRKVQFREFVEKVQFFESFQKKQFFESFFKTLCILQKNLWVVFTMREGFNSVIFFCQKNSILWVISETKRFNSLSHQRKRRFNSLSHKRKCSILWVVFKKWVQFCESCWKEGFNSVSHVKKKFNSVSHIFPKKKNSVTHVLNSLSHFSKKKSSILWLTHIHFFESYWKEGSLSWVILRKKFNSLRHIFQKGSILWVIFSKKLSRIEQSFNSESYLEKKKVEYFESVFFENNIQIFQSWKNQFFELNSKVQFFESYS